MRLMQIVFAGMVAGLAIAGGCAPQRVDTGQQSAALVQGEARVVSVNRTLGEAVLDVGDRQIVGYWQLETAKAQGGDVISGAMRTPDVATYHEPVVTRQEFPAEVGDRVIFVARPTGRAYWLRGVRVVGR